MIDRDSTNITLVFSMRMYKFNRATALVLSLLLSLVLLESIQSFRKFAVSSSYNSNTILFATQKATKKKPNTAFISIEDVDSDLYKLEPVINTLKEGIYIRSIK